VIFKYFGKQMGWQQILEWIKSSIFWIVPLISHESHMYCYCYKNKM
jgi:hypothetical protein